MVVKFKPPFACAIAVKKTVKKISITVDARDRKFLAWSFGFKTEFICSLVL